MSCWVTEVIYWHLSAPTSYISILESCGPLVLGGEMALEGWVSPTALLKHRECNAQRFHDITWCFSPPHSTSRAACPPAAHLLQHMGHVCSQWQRTAAKRCALLSAVCRTVFASLSPPQEQVWLTGAKSGVGSAQGMGKSSGLSRWLCCLWGRERRKSAVPRGVLAGGGSALCWPASQGNFSIRG